MKYSIWTSAISLNIIAIEYMWNREDHDGQWICEELILNIASLTRTEFYFLWGVWSRISLYFEAGFVVALIQANFTFSIIWPLPPERGITRMHYYTGEVFISLLFILYFNPMPHLSQGDLLRLRDNYNRWCYEDSLCILFLCF